MSDYSRRRFLKCGAVVAGGLFFLKRGGSDNAFGSTSPHTCAPPTCAPPTCAPGTLLPGTDVCKFQMPLVIPPAMPQTARPHGSGNDFDYYEIAVREFTQQILPLGMPATTVWGYGSINHPQTFNYPAFTIEAEHKRPVRVKWINDLKDSSGNFLPHLLAVDPTIHWANPPGGTAGRDTTPTFPTTPGPYRGPVPFVTHLHGGAGTAQESDGFAEAWFLPDAENIPAGFATTGTLYDYFKGTSPLGNLWSEGNAVFEYENNQRPATIWYHDHTLGMTRVNVYAGPAGFYLLRGGPGDLHDHVLPGPAPKIGDPPGKKYFEIPLAIQDRSFHCDGSLFYPESRAQFEDHFPGPYIPDSDIPPIWNPEFFGNTIVVNGRTWPELEVERRRYRFRMLNGCNSRFLILTFDHDLPIWLIGTDGGFLPAPVQLDELLLGPANRADVIVDFTNFPVGTEIILLNLGPDSPFAGGVPGTDFLPADPDTTGQVMRFRVVPATSKDKSTPPEHLVLPAFSPLGPASGTRQVSLNELDSAVLSGVGPALVLLGTVSGGVGIPKRFADAITEKPALGATEVWEIFNFTADAHPIHVHEVQFQVVSRTPLSGGQTRSPEPQETGFLDTVIALPGEITRIKMKFTTTGLYVWHCHIVEHEDNDMMRPYHIGPIPPNLPIQ